MRGGYQTATLRTATTLVQDLKTSIRIEHTTDFKALKFGSGRVESVGVLEGQIYDFFNLLIWCDNDKVC